MKCVFYNNISQYANAVIDYLAEAESQNNLMIASCFRTEADSTDWLMASVNDQDGIPQIIALMTPPFKLLLYAPGNQFTAGALEVLADGICLNRFQISGVLAEKSLAWSFSKIYTAKAKLKAEPESRMRVYQLDHINPLELAPGVLRVADQGDLFYLPYWDQAFQLNCGLPMDDLAATTARIRQKLKAQNIYVWEDGIPVSQAAVGRKTLKGAVINAVYTPPHYRSKGYATACVASLSQLLLDSRYDFCCLFADLANPISNQLYLNIDYQPVCDFAEYSFADPSRGQ